MLTISLWDVRLLAPVGVSAEEQHLMAELSLDVEVTVQAHDEVHSLGDTLDYQRLAEVVRQAVSRPTPLLEQVCRQLIAAVSEMDERIAAITVTVRKLHPVTMKGVGSAGVRQQWRRGQQDV
ncbi:MAG: dihydroneopterin aldolase [Chitinophagales bacterium]|nr:dihydroneopterin aldolase [Chitinophagales bacterium]MDW8392832.1 dihydroneopterin aldolase [Chitinophagales bacterium]